MFSTDKQTLDDLNIFGKHGAESIYHIFDRSTTRGGAAVLEQMFRYPLANADAINKRSNTIQYFAASGIEFPFQSGLFDSIELYLDNTDERTKLNVEPDSIGKKLNNLIAVDVHTAQVYKGVHSIVALLKDARAFLDSFKLSAGHPYESDKAELYSLVGESDLSAIVAAKGKLSPSVMAQFDVLLRFRHRELIRKLLHHVHQLDAYIAIGKVAKERGFVFPTALPKDQRIADIIGVYHPQVDHAVSNDIRITAEGNVIFLTGANMAGKSTFMKSLSIAMYLAHMGFPVPAASMRFSVLDGMYTTINLPDNLGMGASHFYSEVLRVKKIASELRHKHLFVLFDELFRGTNVKDAAEATVAVTQAFAKKPHSIFVLSTHIIEAGEELKKRCTNISFIFLPTRMVGNKPVYKYKLEAGITEDRHGMVIINNEGILAILKAGISHNNQQ
ncbi:MutS-related protein [Pedobacter psychroterrae]|uniref:DNA mismatch repair protein n=1 Tax=Pedobacter psychroterrae TaxID=2530453 RepID=A0A4R0NDC5_9SPHI|nr:DNA mismatch repair protein [Pedobacter psychroterrae]TCC98275.1 DNA mismatch repair protein [Pedobacter psychroterrae]